ncbi:carboxypeptidase-like regulatory domain-containing protein [Roseivirga sp. UBA1976]|uniref:carboxypeptidase-like regulatory domain-containing protein n=1 Tax=Roseivirga sp. UBA1976 TaxID=1947386 RepID=UPI00257EFDFB|nr:carboxypeptidase-like regulatory domain-containing protein [Roseivirga sp. UBA1976]
MLKNSLVFKLAFLILFFIPFLAFSQYQIQGVVTDAETGETLPLATVFFAETTFGVTTDTEGRYTLSFSEPGSYEIVARFVGYATYVAKIRIEDERNVRLDITLKPQVLNLGSVVVVAREDKDWRRHMRLFKELFLGYSVNAAKCKILNEEAIDFYMDEEKNVLYAYAEEAIKVQNMGLGYDLEYYLEGFWVDYNSMLSSYVGFTVYREMEARNSRQKGRWDEAREVAFRGSQQHFFRAAYAGKLEEEGFKVARVTDMERGIPKNMTEVDLNELITKGQFEFSRRLPFNDYLHVTYLWESQSHEYIQIVSSLGGAVTRFAEQVSWISLVEGEDHIEFYSNGSVYNPLSFVSKGYWGFEKVADMVPINYKAMN